MRPPALSGRSARKFRFRGRRSSVSVCVLPRAEDAFGFLRSLDREPQKLARALRLTAAQKRVGVGAGDLTLFREVAMGTGQMDQSVARAIQCYVQHVTQVVLVDGTFGGQRERLAV